MTEVVWAVDGSDGGVADRLASVVARGGRKTLVLPGGKTPEPILGDLVSRTLPWETLTILPGDEREVPGDHMASNVGMLMRTFASTPARVEPLIVGMSLPRFDLVWLGMGEDGHVASLFPGSYDPATRPAVVAVTPDPLPYAAPFARRSLTLAALAGADEVIVVIRGAAKRALLETAASGVNDLPIARLLQMTPVEVYWEP